MSPLAFSASNRSHNRGRRQQARGPCRSIEITKCAILEQSPPPWSQRHKLAREPANFRCSRVEFQEIGDRFATLLEHSLNFPSASYIYIYIHIGNAQ